MQSISTRTTIQHGMAKLGVILDQSAQDAFNNGTFLSSSYATMRT